MTTDPTEPLEADLIFSRSESTRSSATWCLVGGSAAVCFAVVGFCLALVTRIGQFAMQSITTVPMLLGIGALAAARVLSRTPTQVSVGPQGACIDDRRGQRRYSWVDIGWAATGTSTMGAGVPGEAEIVRRFVAPNGVTRRLEYRVTGVGGQTGTRNAEVTLAYWESLEDAKTVPVIYVPQEPAVSRLVDGEVGSRDLSDSPAVMIGLSVGLIALCMVFLAAAAMQWYGWDIDLDNKTGRISIKRFGAGR